MLGSAPTGGEKMALLVFATHMVGSISHSVSGMAKSETLSNIIVPKADKYQRNPERKTFRNIERGGKPWPVYQGSSFPRRQCPYCLSRLLLAEAFSNSQTSILT